MTQHDITRAEAQARSGLIATESYRITLDLDDDPRTFGSTSTVDFSAAEGSTTFIDQIAEEITGVSLNGVDLDPTEVVADGRIVLADLAEQNALTVTGRFAYSLTGEGLHRFVDPVDDEVYLYSQFEVADARRVFAVFDQPDLKASFAFSVIAPSHWTVVSNSPTPSPEPREDGRSAWLFAPTPRISSYITAIVAGPYRSVHSTLTSLDGDEVPLGLHARASLFEHLDAEEVFDLTRRGFAYFEDAFEQPYPFEKYDQLFVPEFNAGAMENAGCVTFREDYVFRSRPTEAMVERRAITILHELAHMWFGDLVTMRWWDDLWLNESFAEFASTLAAAEATRFTDAWATFSSLEKSWAYRQDQLPSTHPIVADIADLAAVEVNFDGITYAKGASVLRQLVAWVGLENFLAGLRTYFAAHAWGNTELADLLIELERTSGRDLGDWSRRWLQTAGVNTLRLEVERDEDGAVTAAALLQSAAASHPTLRPHRIAIGAHHTSDGSRERLVECDVDAERTEIPELIGTRADLLLVNDGDLAYGKIRLDAGSLAVVETALERIADPLSRALLRGALWDMTRDAELAPDRYLDIALAGIRQIPDSSGLLVQLRQIFQLLEEYSDPDHRAERIDRVLGALWDFAREAAPGTDQQLQFVRAVARLSCRPAHAELLLELAEERRTLGGLTIDEDLRWALLIGASACGALGEEDLAAARDADDTASGRRSHLTALAARPGSQNKGRVQADLLAGGRNNAETEALLEGFRRGEPTDRTGLAAEYFEAIDGVWRSRSGEIAQQLARGLFPPLSRVAVERTRTWLAEHEEAPAGLLRLMRESLDDAERGLRCREVDA